MKVSIIIPVYNAEKYLRQCIDSVIQQTYRDLEIILVDDGSTDNSGKICDEYAIKDSRIKVFHINNSGVSFARNKGIQESSGQYLMFVDSDDYIDLNMVEILISEISQSKSDLVICGYTTVTHENYIKSQCKKAFLKGKKEISNYIIKNYHPGYINSPCNKLYRKDLIKHYFDENQSLGEDLLFNIDYLKSVNSINCINDCLYYYRRENNESLSLRYRSDLLKLRTYKSSSVP
jgi:glycosyltransferase involved in cell wall biosynthesis